MQGHLRERQPDRWEVLYDIGPDPLTGKRRQRSKTIHGTRQAAEFERDQITLQ